MPTSSTAAGLILPSDLVHPFFFGKIAGKLTTEVVPKIIRHERMIGRPRPAIVAHLPPNRRHARPTLLYFPGPQSRQSLRPGPVDGLCVGQDIDEVIGGVRLLLRPNMHRDIDVFHFIWRHCLENRTTPGRNEHYFSTRAIRQSKDIRHSLQAVDCIFPGNNAWGKWLAPDGQKANPISKLLVFDLEIMAAVPDRDKHVRHINACRGLQSSSLPRKSKHEPSLPTKLRPCPFPVLPRL